MHAKQLMGLLVLMAGLSLTIRAEDERRGGGIPATPEPYVIAMLVGGVGVVGGYIAYRIRKNKPH